MPSIRLDKVIFSTFHEAYKNYHTATGSIAVVATSLANGATRTVTATIPYDRGGTRADVYVSGNGVKTIATGGPRAAGLAVYERTSTETASIFVRYTSTDVLVVLSIFNGTGGSITPIAQTIDVSVVQYEAPIAAI